MCEVYLYLEEVEVLVFRRVRMTESKRLLSLRTVVLTAMMLKPVTTKQDGTLAL